MSQASLPSQSLLMVDVAKTGRISPPTLSELSALLDAIEARLERVHERNRREEIIPPISAAALSAQIAEHLEPDDPLSQPLIKMPFTPLENVTEALTEAEGADVQVLRPGKRKVITTMDLTMDTCRWPLGDPADSDFHYCGELPLIRNPYCEIHDAQCRPGTRNRKNSRKSQPDSTAVQIETRSALHETLAGGRNVSDEARKAEHARQ